MLLGVANIGFFSVGLFHRYFFGEILNVPKLNISNVVLWNIVPTGLGNMLGSFVFVSITYSFIFSSNHIVKKLAQQNGEVKKEEKPKGRIGNISLSVPGTPFLASLDGSRFASESNSPKFPTSLGKGLNQKTKSGRFDVRDSKVKKFHEMHSNERQSSTLKLLNLKKKKEKMDEEKDYSPKEKEYYFINTNAVDEIIEKFDLEKIELKPNSQIMEEMEKQTILETKKEIENVSAVEESNQLSNHKIINELSQEKIDLREELIIEEIHE
jgi:predicted membrane protein